MWSINKLKNLIIEINDIEYQIKKNSVNSINLTTNFLLENRINFFNNYFLLYQLVYLIDHCHEMKL